MTGVSGSPERLIDTAVRNLPGDAETRAAARSALGQTIAELDTLPAERAAAMISRWDEVDGRKGKLSWQSVPGLLVLLALLMVIATNLRVATVYRYLWTNHPHARDQFHYQARMDLLARRWSPADRLLVLGSSSGINYGSTSEDLWRSDPENPAYFAEHAARMLIETGNLPADFLDIADRIDPGNAYFRYLAATRKLREMKVHPGQANFARDHGKTYSWSESDRKILDEAIFLAATASGMERFQTYSREMMRSRLALLSQANRFDYLISYQVFLEAGKTEAALHELTTAFSAKAHLLTTHPDKAALTMLLRTVGAYYRQRLDSDDGFLPEDLKLDATATGVFGQLSWAEGQARTGEEEPPIAGLTYSRLRQRDQAHDRSRRGWAADLQSDIWNHGDLMSGFSLRRDGMDRLVNPPVITVDDFLPGNHSDHALVSRILVICIAAALGIVVLALRAHRFMASRLTLHLSGRIALLLRPVDYAWIVGLGMLLPVCHVIGISRLTGYSARDASVEGREALAPLGQHLALLLMMVIAVVMISRWRLEKRATGLLPPRRKPWAGWVALVSAAVSVPVLGCAVPLPTVLDHDNLVIPAALLAIPVILVFAALIRSPLGRGAGCLESSTVTRVILPMYGIAALLMLCLVPVFTYEENAWFRRHKLIRLDAGTGTTPFEQVVSRNLREDLKKALNPLDYP